MTIEQSKQVRTGDKRSNHRLGSAK